MHLSPDSEVSVQLHSQVGGVDLRALRRVGLDGAATCDVGAASAAPEIGDEVADRGMVAE
jgi:hypothetical protein